MIKNKKLRIALQDYVLPLSLFALITVFFTYPVSVNPGSMILGRPFEDAFEYVWYLSWYKEALVDAGVSPLFQPDIFYPSGWNLSFAAFPPIHPTLAVPFTALFGAVAAYNLYIMFTCVFAAFGVYRLVCALAGNAWGAIFAGIAFAFYPQRSVYLAGHLNFLTGSMWLPWLFYGVVSAKQSIKHRTAWMAFVGFSFAMSIGGSWHFLFLSGLGFSLFMLVYLWADLRDQVQRKCWWQPFVAFVVTTAVVIGPFLINALIAREQLGGNAHYAFANTNNTSVSLERFLIPSAVNPIFWDFARVRFPLWNGQDAVVHFGYIVLLLGIYALWRLRPWSSTIRALFVMFIVAVSLMFGLTLHWMGSSVTISMSNTALFEQFLPELIIENNEIGIPMPASLLYLLVPPFRNFHAFSRWGLVAMMGLAVLAGLGLSHFLRQRQKKVTRIMFGCVALLILLFEFNTQPFPDVTKIEDIQRGVDTWLAAHPEQNIIIEYPIHYAMKGQTLYYTTIHKQKIVHGAGSLLPQMYTINLPILNQWPDESATILLQELGVRYALVDVFDGDTIFAEETLPTILANESLTLVQVFEEKIGPIGTIYVFEISPSDLPADANQE